MAFPEGFLWGTAASSTQTEGAAPASDWRASERAGLVPPSGDGNGFATGFADDLALFAGHGLTHHRLTLEWARLEPEPGRHDTVAVEHYRTVLEAARDAGVSPWACLHHFSSPGWFSVDEHGFPDKRSRTYFWPRHVDFVADTFGDLVAGWVPIAEPGAHARNGWLGGGHPPHVDDRQKFPEALEALHLANFDAARRLRGLGRPVAAVHDLSPLRSADASAEADTWRRMLDDVQLTCWVDALRDGSLTVPGRAAVEQPWFRDAFDLVGISYTHAIGVHGDGSFSPYPADARVGPLGFAPWSDGLAEVLHRVAELLPDQPLLVAAHGVATDDDRWRTDLLRRSMELVGEALDDGIDVRGFFHATGIDAYDWRRGFQAPSGLFDRDRDAKPSAALAAEVARGA